jgi:hypothetical protein
VIGYLQRQTPRASSIVCLRESARGRADSASRSRPPADDARSPRRFQRPLPRGESEERCVRARLPLHRLDAVGRRDASDSGVGTRERRGPSARLSLSCRDSAKTIADRCPRWLKAHLPSLVTKRAVCGAFTRKSRRPFARVQPEGLDPLVGADDGPPPPTRTDARHVRPSVRPPADAASNRCVACARRAVGRQRTRAGGSPRYADTISMTPTIAALNAANSSAGTHSSSWTTSPTR